MSKLKTVLKTLILVLLGSLVSVGVFYGAAHHLSQMPTVEQIQDFDNVSRGLSIGHQRVIKRSRNSTVRILSVSTGHVCKGERKILYNYSYACAGRPL